MNLREFAATVALLGIPAVYGYYMEEKTPPYLAYRSTTKNVLHADGIVVYSEEWVTLEFVSRNRDLDAERSIEAFLTIHGIAFDSPECFFDEKQKIHIVRYEFQLE